MKCKICNEEVDYKDYIQPTSKEMKKNHLCFSCWFWNNHYEEDKKREKYTYAIVDGEHYILSPSTNSYFQGFGGRKFVFKFNDGTIKECSNVWFQGKIPEEWKDKFPDNAIIIR